ncbi:sulfur oxidation c-type cytochrome SoxA [Pelagibius sp. 7325]|uniref:sulfur oxidation c-type cytochrome SoxA n=1 Tax=Pelagibius sp. 7325 TaxID=3131994 RepID=UPI0030EEBF90
MNRWVQGFLAVCAAPLAGVLWIEADAASPDDKRSGVEFVSPQTRQLQEDDTSNPGMLWVLEGEQLWQEPAGYRATACADCHGAAETVMRGVATRYPQLDEQSERTVDLQGRVNLCRTRHQEAAALAFESQELLALTAFIGYQSRGMPLTASEDERLTPFIDSGRRLYSRRMGQLDLACADCHDARWGQRLSGSLIPQAHPTGYPVYRLEWQTVGSLQRRFRNCMVGVRAEPFDYGAPEMVDLELYLRQRAAGLPIETPAVRP